MIKICLAVFLVVLVCQLAAQTTVSPHHVLPPGLQTGQLTFSSETKITPKADHIAQLYNLPGWTTQQRIVVAMKDYFIEESGKNRTGGLSRWELNLLQESEQCKLELVMLNPGSIWTVKVSYLKLEANLFGWAAVHNNIIISRQFAIKSIGNLMVTFGAAQKSRSAHLVPAPLLPVLLLSGITIKRNDVDSCNFDLQLNATLLGSNHLHITTSHFNFQKIKLSLLLIDTSHLPANNLVLHRQTYPSRKEAQSESGNNAAFEQTNNQQVFVGMGAISSNCRKTEDGLDSCQEIWGMEELAFWKLDCPEGFELKQGVCERRKSRQEFQLTQETNYEEMMLSRLLHSCSETTFTGCYNFVSCPTTASYLNATVCIQRWSQPILIYECGVGSYTLSKMVSTCTACPNSPANCIDCQRVKSSTTPECILCAAGYYLTSSSVCSGCPSSCQTCQLTQSGLTCLLCKSTFQPKVVNGLTTCVCTASQYLSALPECVNCSTTYPGCKTCTPLLCSVCLTGFYRTSPTCTACNPVCLNCTSGTSCAACKNNLVFSAGSCDCPASTYLNPTTLTCEPCTTLQPNCDLCGYQSGSYNQSAPSPVACSDASPQHYLIGNGSTGPCIPYCQECLDGVSCSQPFPFFDCSSGTCVCSAAVPPLFINAAGTACEVCSNTIAGCTTCVINSMTNTVECEACTEAGFYSLTAAVGSSVSSCSACRPQCQTCNNYNLCGGCISGLVPENSICSCDSSATSYLYLVPGTLNTCASCPSIFINCNTCINNDPFAKCTGCLDNYFPNSDGTACLPCLPICRTCDTPTTCILCIAGYTPQPDGSCTCDSTCSNCLGNSTGSCPVCTLGTPVICHSCEVGYSLDAAGTACILCPSTLHCLECSDAPTAACLTCASSFVMVAAGCICNTSASKYLTLAGTACDDCGAVIINCTSCALLGSPTTGTTVCLQCLSGHFVVVPANVSCQPCSNNCATCETTSTHCLTCLPPLDLLAGNVCGCDPAITKYFDPLTGGCSLCSALFVNCVTCAANSPNITDTLCLNCSTGYYPASDGKSCLPCPSKCADCNSPTDCTLCASNLVLSNSLPSWSTPGLCVCDNETLPVSFWDSEDEVCLVCSMLIVGCTSCSDNGSAVVCGGCVDGTYLNSTSNLCLNCDSSCANCSSLATTCTSCPAGLTLSSSMCVCTLSCTKCQMASPNCLSCSLNGDDSINTCTSCLTGFYLSSQDCLACPSTCASCTAAACLTCQPSFTLIGTLCSCNPQTDEFQNGGVCMTCSNIFYGCTKCEFDGVSTTCVDCQPGYYVSAGTCLPCSPTCQQCSLTSSNCTACPAGYTLSAGTCTCTTCSSCSAAGCTNCSSCLFTITGLFSQCQSCAVGSFLNTVTHQCAPCPTTCLTCGSGGACVTCNATFQVVGGVCQCDLAGGYLLNNLTNLCAACGSVVSNCATCNYNASSANNIGCAQCSPSHYLLNGSCVASTCGDGQVTSGEQCDDGNTANLDGCSTYCMVENNYQCAGSPSLCLMQLDFSITPHSVIVDTHDCNKVRINFAMHPAYSSYDSADFSKMLIQTSLSFLTLKKAWYKEGLATYEFEYSQNVDQRDTSFYFNPPLLGVHQTLLIPFITVRFIVNSSNNLPAIYYPKEICENKATTEKVIKGIQYTSYAILIVSALPAKIVGLELFGVLQLAFFSVGNMDNVNTLMASMMDMTWVNGLNLNVDDKEKTRKDSRLLQSSALTPNRVQSIGYASNFLRNCNLMFLLVTAVIGVAFVLFGLSYLCKKCAPSLFSISRRLFKEVLLTLILFNCYNFAYSAGLHFYYAVPEDPLYTLGTVAASATLIIPTLMAVALMCSEEDGFGEYKDKLKDGAVEKGYFVATILYRTGMGLYVATMNEDELSTLIVMAMSILWLLYNLVNLPFRKAYHNYRANICHLTQFVCLFVTLYYRSMMSTTNAKTTAVEFTPVYIQLTCIVISLLVSLIVLVYEVYLFIKNCCQQSKKSIKPSDEQSQRNEKKMQISVQNLSPEKAEKEQKDCNAYLNIQYDYKE